MTPEGSRMVAGASRSARPPDPRPWIHSTPEGSRKASRFDSKHAASRCVRDPCRGRDIGPPLTGGSELTLATTGYRARPLQGRTPDAVLTSWYEWASLNVLTLSLFRNCARAVPPLRMTVGMTVVVAATNDSGDAGG